MCLTLHFNVAIDNIPKTRQKKQKKRAPPSPPLHRVAWLSSPLPLISPPVPTAGIVLVVVLVVVGGGGLEVVLVVIVVVDCGGVVRKECDG